MRNEICNKCGKEVIEDRKLDNTIWRCPDCGLEEYLSKTDRDDREEYLCDFIRCNCKDITKLSGSFLADGERVQFVVDNNLDIRLINYKILKEYIIKARYRMLSLASSVPISKFSSSLEERLSLVIGEDIKTKVERIQFDVSVVYFLVQLFSNAEYELNSSEESIPSDHNIKPLNKDGSVYAIISNRRIEIKGKGKFEGPMWWVTKLLIRDNTLALAIHEGVQFPDNSKYLFDGYNGTIEIYPDIDVSNIVVAKCMFANTEKANPNTTNWKLSSGCNMEDMFLNAKAYTGKQFD